MKAVHDRKSIPSRPSKVTALLFLLPAIVVFLFFKWIPMIASVVLSFVKWDTLTNPEFVGLTHFKNLTLDPLFKMYLMNNVYYAFFYFGLGFVLPIVLAILCNEIRKGRRLVKFCYLLPVFFPCAAVFLLWRWIYNPDFGLVTNFLTRFGIDGPGWLSSISWVKPSIVIVGVWQTLGVATIVYLAALRAIPAKSCEGAKNENSSFVKRLFFVTLPNLRWVMLIMLILVMVWSLCIFGQTYMMTGGGPFIKAGELRIGMSSSLLYYVYTNAFQWFKMGYASAVDSIIIAVLFLLGLALMMIAKKSSLRIYFLKKEEIKATSNGVSSDTCRSHHKSKPLVSISYLILTFFAIAVIIPFIWGISTSLKEGGDVFTYPPQWIPEYTAWRNYCEAWVSAPFPRFFANSLFCSFTICLFQVVISFLAAYSLSFLKPLARRLLSLGFLSTMLIPSKVLVTPIFSSSRMIPEVLNNLFRTTFWTRDVYLQGHFIGRPIGIDSYFALIVPSLAWAWGIFLFKIFFDGLKPALAEAREKETSEWTIFWRTIVPKCKPMIALVAVVSFFLSWNQFLWPLIVTNSTGLKTLNIGLVYFQRLHITGSHLLMAGAMIAGLPMVIICAFVFRSFHNSVLRRLVIKTGRV